MTATYTQARDEILTLVNTIWEPTGFPMFWENIAGTIPTTNIPWARTTIQHFFAEQATLANFDGTSRFNRRGLLTTQIFVPSGEGLSRAYTLAILLIDALEGASTSRGVWFRNTRLNEIGAEGNWSQINVLSDFSYDEIK
jgi:Bacteriophage related domain of unknown function